MSHQDNTSANNEPAGGQPEINFGDSFSWGPMRKNTEATLIASEKGVSCSDRPASYSSHSSNPKSRLDSYLPEPTVPDLWLHPGLGLYGKDVFGNKANFLPDSRVDVLTVSGPENRLGECNAACGQNYWLTS